MPGPMFSISAFFGAIIFGSGGVPGHKVGEQVPVGDLSQPLLGTLCCWASLMLPGVFIVLGFLPYWEDINKYKSVKTALKGENLSSPTICQ